MDDELCKGQKGFFITYVGDLFLSFVSREIRLNLIVSMFNCFIISVSHQTLLIEFSLVLFKNQLFYIV